MKPLISIFLLCLLLSACGRTLYPVTNGSYRTLPHSGTFFTVWGSHTAAVLSTEAWLEARGLVLVPKSKLKLVAGDAAVQPSDVKIVLPAAAAAGVEIVVVVDPSSNPAFPASVQVSALDAMTGESVWTAAAWFADPDLRLDEAPMDILVCQALATLWGFRPAGYHEISSNDMCDVQKTRPHGHPSGSYKRLG
jgi:hypothetical protein